MYNTLLRLAVYRLDTAFCLGIHWLSRVHIISLWYLAVVLDPVGFLSPRLFSLLYHFRVASGFSIPTTSEFAGYKTIACSLMNSIGLRHVGYFGADYRSLSLRLDTSLLSHHTASYLTICEIW